MTEDSGFRARSGIEWGTLLRGLLVALVVAVVLALLYWQFAVNPNLWDVLTMRANH
jgi:hypothetical protein